ncbi:MAG: glutamate--cysteine ligase [Gammaproteobacteria bacterium]
MGEEIDVGQFSEEDYLRFQRKLQEENRLLHQWFSQDKMDDRKPVAGFELEAWLLDENYRPAPLNEAYLQKLASPLASPELASFNFEVNSTPQDLRAHALSTLYSELVQTWKACQQTAQGMGCQSVMVGILPTLQNEDLNLANMSKMTRYRALNREVIRQRRGKPLVFDINGIEHLHVTHRDVMLEAAATSFQIHIQVAPKKAARFYNASIIASGPMVAVSANSPFLFEKNLWDETRIPVFEQAVAVGGYGGAAFGPIKRVTFGSGYVRNSLLECFDENVDHYPILLPVDYQDDDERLHHLRLHNGTIWRWNRPLIGFDEHGQAHLRIEHRVVPAGPSLVDTIANAAFYYGIVAALAEEEVAPESKLLFDKARDNFYNAARHGLRANMQWLDGKQYNMRELCLDKLLPMAKQGLDLLGIASDDSNDYLSIIEHRLLQATNGATWQRHFIDKYGKDMTLMLKAYMERQNSGEPVHEWTI